MKHARTPLLMGLIGLAACSSDGTDGKTPSVLVSTYDGDECSSGGVQIRSGVDADGDGELSEEETTSSEVVCNGGSDGGSSSATLVDVGTVDAGGACGATSGTSLQTYMDKNGNGSLDEGEAKGAPQYVCGGTRLSTSTVAPGAECASGGVALQSWQDVNGNGSLDTGEEQGDPSYVCASRALPNVSVTAQAVRNDTAFPDSFGYPNVTTPGAGPGPLVNPVFQASITVPGAGAIFAVASSTLYCDRTGDPDYACGTGDSYVYLSIVRDGQSIPSAITGTPGSVYLGAGGLDVPMGTTETFGVTEAGTYTYNVVAQMTTTGGAGAALVQYTELSLIYLPNI